MRPREEDALRSARAAVGLAALLAVACRSAHERDAYWSFALSREAYTTPVLRSADGGSGAYAALVLDALPLAIDLALLPVTGVHDLCVGWPR